jgi:signal transduction histidine kinase
VNDGSSAAPAELPADIRRRQGGEGTLCLRLGADYCLRHCHGTPAAYGLGDLAPGIDVRSAAPYVDHFDEREQMVLPRINTANSRTVDLTVIPAVNVGEADGGWYVLFTPVDAAAQVQRERQQRENEARMRAGRLQGRLVQATAEAQLWRDQAEEARRATWRLAGSLTHELRTPLSAIVGYARLLRQALGDSPEQRQHLDAIERGAEHISQLIDATLAQYRRDATEVIIHREPTDLHRLVTQLTELMAPLAADKGLGFGAYVGPSVPARISVDAMRVRQVLLNLLGNAVKFTEEGSVRLEASWADGELRLAVDDTGPGIAPEHQARVFAAFDRAGREDYEVGGSTPGAAGGAADGPTAPRRDRAAGGSGLGLHIARDMVRRMGGKIALASVPGRGSRFSVSLPAEAIAVGAGGHDTAEVVPGRLLVGEDDGDLQRLLAVFLGQAGFDVSFVSRGEALLQQVRTFAPPQLCLLDLNLADSIEAGDGLQVARRLREAGYDGPLVAMSAGDAAQLAPAALAAGCNAFIAKPIRPEALLQRLFDVLRNP